MKMNVKLSSIGNGMPCCRPVVTSNTLLVNAVTSILYHIAHFTMYIPNNCLVCCEFYKKLITFYTRYCFEKHFYAKLLVIITLNTNKGKKLKIMIPKKVLSKILYFLQWY